ncbi:MAG: hypothetical protein AB8F65_07680 [Woeseiaceae bacterium]
MKKLLPISALLAATLLAVGCGKKDSPADVADAPGTDLLAYVPADTPYVFASLSPMPKDYLKKMEPFQQQAGEMMTAMMEGVTASTGDNPDENSQAIVEFVSFIYEFIQPERMKEFGLDLNSTSAIYGHGVLPVLRSTLADADKFMPRLKELAKEREFELVAGKAGGIDYERIEINEEIAIVTAVSDDMLVIALAPSTFSDDNLAVLLGDSKPASSLKDAGTLTALATKYNYIPQGMGYFNLEQLAATFLDGPSGLDKALMELVGENPAANIDATCKAEYKSIAAVMPRIAMGYTAVSGKEMSLLPVFEMREDIATALVPVASSVPGLTTESDALMKFGFGVNLKGLREFIESKVASIVEDPYQCAELANLNMSAMQMVESLNQPLPPIVYNFKGIAFELDNLHGIDLTNPSVPDSIDASLMLAFDNVEGLVQMGQMFVPPLAMMELSADGESVQIPQELLTGYNGEAFVAMSENLLSVASGKGASSKVASMVKTTDAGEPVLMAMSFDMAAYMTMINDVQKSAMDKIEAAEGDADADVVKLLEANDDMMKLYAEVFDREDVAIKPTANGLEMPVRITFQ